MKFGRFGTHLNLFKLNQLEKNCDGALCTWATLPLPSRPARLSGLAKIGLGAHPEQGMVPTAHCRWWLDRHWLVGGDVSWGGTLEHHRDGGNRFLGARRLETHRRVRSTVAQIGRRGMAVMGRTVGR
jgi:hypothetical protein